MRQIFVEELFEREEMKELIEDLKKELPKEEESGIKIIDNNIIVTNHEKAKHFLQELIKYYNLPKFALDSNLTQIPTGDAIAYYLEEREKERLKEKWQEPILSSIPSTLPKYKAKNKHAWHLHEMKNDSTRTIVESEYKLKLPEENEDWIEFLNGNGGTLYLTAWHAVDEILNSTFAGKLPQAVEYEEERKKGSKIKKIIGSAALTGVLLTAIAYASSKSNQKPTTITDMTKDSNNDGLPDLKAMELGLNSNKTYPIIGKAYQMGFNDSILKELISLNNSVYGYNLTKKRIDFLKALASFPSNQYEFLKWVMKDGKITQEEYEQAKFLASLSKEEFEKAAKNNLLNDTNWDNDIWTNYVEKFITKTNYTVPNNLYVVLVESMLENEKWWEKQFRVYSDILSSIGVGRDHLFILNGKNATFYRFTSIINVLSSLATKNDIVLISFGGHGSNTGFCFVDECVNYADIGKVVDKLDKTNSSIVIVNSACFGGSSFPYFCKDSRVVISNVDEKHESWHPVIPQLFYWVSKLEADFDKNGYVSVGELFQYYYNKRMEWNIEYNTTAEGLPQICNMEQAKNTYIITLPQNREV
jgi:hypothetical protein